jgi:hypothetical protein
MTTQLSFEKAVEYLNASFNTKASGKSGTVTLKNSSQEDCLILQSENAGERVSLFAPFLEKPPQADIQKKLNLHLLHLNADLDTLGSLRITLNTDTNRYSLCDGALTADNPADFAQYLQEVLKTAQYLHQEITDALLELGQDQQADSDDLVKSGHYLKA